MQTRAGSDLFVSLYDIYKDRIEAAGNHALAKRIPVDSWVVDVGANVGFFTERFARWVSGRGRVIAVEPDAKNTELLKRRIAARNLTVVDLHHAAATDETGFVHLRLNPHHPGDHRISDSGERVAAVRLDELVEQAGNPSVCLIKVDTQGNELRVLKGAERTLERCRPNLFVEVDDRSLRENATSADELINFLACRGYTFSQITSLGAEKTMPAWAVGSALASAQRGYTDLLCIYDPQHSQPSISSIAN